MKTKETKMRTSAIKKNCANFLAVLSLVLSATAFDAQAQTIRGYRSCGVWVSERALKGIGSSLAETWLIGYLSGLASATGKDLLKGTDNLSIYLWVDNYCRANPLEKIDEAGDVLAVELIKQKKL